MLDADGRLTVPEAPDVAVYTDTDDPARFYAFAAGPRIARGSDGALLLSLLVYRHGRDGPSEGGQLSLTTTLAITTGERDALAAALSATPPRHGDPRDAGDPGDRGAGPPPSGAAPSGPPTIVPPDWLAADVTVQLAEGLELRGAASLAGTNDCAIAVSLAPGGVDLARQLLDRGLPGVTATYAVEIRAGRRASASTERIAPLPGGVGTVRTEVARTAAERLLLELRGPLRAEPVAGADTRFTTDVVL